MSISVYYNSVQNKFVEKKITELFILIRFEFNKYSYLLRCGSLHRQMAQPTETTDKKFSQNKL
jgi:hypothetical protein